MFFTWREAQVVGLVHRGAWAFASVQTGHPFGNGIFKGIVRLIPESALGWIGWK